MQNITDLLIGLQKKGVIVSLNGENLKISAPKGVLKDEDKAFLKENKAEIIAYFKENPATHVITDAKNTYAPFPLTEIQKSYLVGQESDYEYGGTNCKIYSEIEFDDLDRQKSQEAWEKTVFSNNMLHAVINKDSTQCVLKDYLIPEIGYYDFSDMTENEAEPAHLKVREKMKQNKYEAGTWPQFEVAVIKRKDKSFFCISLDMLIADFVSVNLIFEEFERFYFGQDVKTTDLTFRDVVNYRENLKNTVEYQQKYMEDKIFWEERIKDMPLEPELPTVEGQSPVSESDFDQLIFNIEEEEYRKIADNAKTNGLTTSNLLLLAYYETLKTFSATKSFFINLAMADRPRIHPDIDRVVGDFTTAAIMFVEGDNFKTYKDEALSIQKNLFETLEHNSYPSAAIVRKLSKRAGKILSFPAVFTSTIGAVGGDLSQRKGKVSYSVSMTPQVLIDCQAVDAGGALRLNWDVRKGAFPEGFTKEAFELFKENVKRLTDKDYLSKKPETTLPKETLKRRISVNDTKADIPKEMLYQGFLKQLSKNPDKKALSTDDADYTYKELASYVNAICDKLSGLKKGEPVAVALSPGVWQIAAVLAVMIKGGAYLPIDIDQPPKRAESIIKSAKAEKIFVDSDRFTSIEGAEQINTGDLSPKDGADIEVVDADVDSPAYIIFTSGSTGTPKGVVISHRAASNTLLDINERFSVTDKDVILNVVNLSFDLSVYNIFGSFFAGALLVVTSKDNTRQPEVLLSLIEKHNVSVWNSVPAQMKMLTMASSPKNYNSMKLILLSGDWVPTSLPKEIKKMFPAARQISLGGATEAAVWSIYHEIDLDRNYRVSIPYGKPLANQHIYVLNDQLDEVADYVTGEIYIGGEGLALKYLGDEKKTAERFIVNPATKERLYKTGDLGRYLPDGEVEFKGRADFQIKVRGHRVEAGEIETAAKEAFNLKNVKLIATKRGGGVSLVLFAVAEGEEPEIEAVTKELADRLPSYMIPSFYKFISEIPVTGNGKVDSKALERLANDLIDEKQHAGGDENEVLNEAENKIHKVWCEVFGVDLVGLDEDFFNFGGDSILIVKLLSDIENKYGFKISLREVYTEPTIRYMAKLASGGSMQ